MKKFIMQLANRLRKSGLTLSAALKAAWALFKKAGVTALEFIKKETAELRFAQIAKIVSVDVWRDLVKFVEIDADGKEKFRSCKLSLIVGMA